MLTTLFWAGHSNTDCLMGKFINYLLNKYSFPEKKSFLRGKENLIGLGLEKTGNHYFNF